ncbi:ABC transporter ATP-binding protein [Marinobacter sp. Z-F4-2]|nr:ABC transporter ATP-binding protein [Marinobacter sp. Z-F4-2]
MKDSLLDVENLTAKYGESQVVHGASFHVNRGEVVTLLGRNGAGKTTTLRAIMGVLETRQGSIRFDGEEIIGLSSDQIARRGVGYVPEERGIFSSLTVKENLMLPPVINNNPMPLDEIYSLFPNIRERLTSRGTHLSGGEQQMLAMARVLRTGAHFLLLDEPTEGLAPIIIDAIAEVIKVLKSRGTTILLVEQNSNFASQLADRHYVFQDGSVVKEFTNEEVLSDPTKIERYLSVEVVSEEDGSHV